MFIAPPAQKGEQFTKVSLTNRLIFHDYYIRLSLLALSMFKWENLPKSVSPRYMEQCLYRYGQAVFFYDEEKGYLCLRALPSGELNVYEEPIFITAQSINYTRTFSLNECVFIRNNYFQYPTEMTIKQYSEKLYEIDRTADINIKAQKTPVLIKCTEKNKLSLQKVYMNYDGNMPVQFADKEKFDIDSITVLKTDAPFIADKLTLQKHEIWNEAMTFLGVNNANTDKKERLITDEANANNQLIKATAETMLETRQEAAKQINEMYGLDVSVNMRNPNERDEVINGEIHN